MSTGFFAFFTTFWLLLFFALCFAGADQVARNHALVMGTLYLIAWSIMSKLDGQAKP